MKLLVIEDNHRLATQIKKCLKEVYTPEVAHTGKGGLELATSQTYECIILDLGLPDISGSTVCKEVRKAGIYTPILILSAVGNIESKISLLESGADDYLTKPFHPGELRARLCALLRRQPYKYTDSIIKLGDLELDPSRRSVLRAGQKITLRRKEFDILQYLIKNRGRAVTREMILNWVWSSDKNSMINTVDVHIKYLRDKVDRPFKNSLIKTAHGVGYTIEDS